MPAASGTFAITVTVTDSNGVSASGTATIEVIPSMGGTPSTQGYLAHGAMVALVAIVAAILVLLVVRRKKNPRA